MIEEVGSGKEGWGAEGMGEVGWGRGSCDLHKLHLNLVTCRMRRKRALSCQQSLPFS
jgi:hypothetical protein